MPWGAWAGRCSVWLDPAVWILQGGRGAQLEGQGGRPGEAESGVGGFPQKSCCRAGFPGITGKGGRRGQCAKCVVLVGMPGVCWWQSFWGSSLCLCQKEETTFWGNHCSLRGQINTPIPICPSRVLSLPRCPQPGASEGDGQAAGEGPTRLWSAVFPKSRRQAGCPSLSQEAARFPHQARPFPGKHK